ncbi:MAG TPA: pentapeptide repeat-containing protein, partial [Nitrososphaeraceae archaeon]
FTIGIFGEWGTGKTTLINSVDTALQTDGNLIRVKFEAWRYTQEQFPLVSLLKNIAYALPSEKQFEVLKEKLVTSSINFHKNTTEILTSVISKFASEEDEISQEMFDSFKKELISKIQLIAQLDKDSVYFDGLHEIKNEIKKLRLVNPTFRMVVFVDDIDKCSPKKVHDIFEIIRVFQDVEGFIFILGISDDMIIRLSEIGNRGKNNGERYIKNLIQIHIALPKWSNEDIVKLVRDFIKKDMFHDNLKDVVDKNIELISLAIENNPREIKRFLNNFIVAYEIFAGKKSFEARELIFAGKKSFEARELLVIQAIHLRWKKFYKILVKSDQSFFKVLDKYLKMDQETRLKNLEMYEGKKGDDDIRVWKVLSDFKTDSDLWNFLGRNLDTLRNIRDWNMYRIAIDITVEPTTLYGKSINYEAVKLLQSGKISEFNDKRIIEFKTLSLSGADLRDADLRDADLRDADLRDADLRDADLRDADLRDADLMGANLSGARLVGTNLSGADLTSVRFWGANLARTRLWGANLRDAHLVGAKLHGANLGGARLAGANLGGARLAGVDLSGADLNHTELTNSIIINPDYELLTIDSTTVFNNATIDDPQFIDYISQYTRNVPQKIKDKKKLKRELAKKGVSEENIEELLSNSKIPEE